MPLYEYECSQCKNRTEVLQKMADPVLTECESCGGELRKLVSSPAIQFKGSGFYLTDYKRSGNGSGSATPTEGKSEPKAESPAAKADTAPSSD